MKEKEAEPKARRLSISSVKQWDTCAVTVDSECKESKEHSDDHGQYLLLSCQGWRCVLGVLMKALMINNVWTGGCTKRRLFGWEFWESTTDLLFFCERNWLAWDAILTLEVEKRTLDKETSR